MDGTPDTHSQAESLAELLVDDEAKFREELRGVAQMDDDEERSIRREPYVAIIVRWLDGGA